jgi:dTDP-4-amino-4,6-dideoxygalactose transaminase
MARKGSAWLIPSVSNIELLKAKINRGGRVIWVDVDASTGKIICRSKP